MGLPPGVWGVFNGSPGGGLVIGTSPNSISGVQNIPFSGAFVIAGPQPNGTTAPYAGVPSLMFITGTSTETTSTPEDDCGLFLYKNVNPPSNSLLGYEASTVLLQTDPSCTANFPTTGLYNFLLAAQSQVQHNGSGNAGELYGFFCSACNAGSGTATLVNGLQVEAINIGTQAVPEAIGIFIVGTDSPLANGIGSWTGLQIASQGTAVQTNATGIYIDQVSTNVFAINIGLHINSQVGGAGSGIKVEGPARALWANGGPVLLDEVSVLQWSATSGNANPDTGLTRQGAGIVAVGNGNIGGGNASGQLNLTKILVTTSSAAPTSAGTAGTAGELIYFGGLMYFCSVTGVAGAATWNKLSMAAV